MSVALPCVCASLRRASRAVTQLYEDALRPLGLGATQFSVLQALSMTGSVTQRTLGEILGMDSTTLTRTLRILIRRGWVKKIRGEDRREWHIGLTKAGNTQLKLALPRWQEAQARLRQALGGDAWEELRKITQTVTDAVVDFKEKS